MASRPCVLHDAGDVHDRGGRAAIAGFSSNADSLLLAGGEAFTRCGDTPRVRFPGGCLAGGDDAAGAFVGACGSGCLSGDGPRRGGMPPVKHRFGPNSNKLATQIFG